MHLSPNLPSDNQHELGLSVCYSHVVVAPVCIVQHTPCPMKHTVMRCIYSAFAVNKVLIYQNICINASNVVPYSEVIDLSVFQLVNLFTLIGAMRHAKCIKKIFCCVVQCILCILD